MTSADIASSESFSSMSLGSLKRMDSNVSEIIASASYASVYRLMGERTWQKADIEGPLFVVSRTRAPFHKLLVLNQKTQNNLYQPITPTWDVSSQSNYFFWREGADDATPQVWGAWFFHDDERRTICSVIQNVLQKSSHQHLHDDRKENASAAGDGSLPFPMHQGREAKSAIGPAANAAQAEQSNTLLNMLKPKNRDSNTFNDFTAAHHHRGPNSGDETNSLRSLDVDTALDIKEKAARLRGEKGDEISLSLEPQVSSQPGGPDLGPPFPFNTLNKWDKRKPHSSASPSPGDGGASEESDMPNTASVFNERQRDIDGTVRAIQTSLVEVLSSKTFAQLLGDALAKQR